MVSPRGPRRDRVQPSSWLGLVRSVTDRSLRATRLEPDIPELAEDFCDASDQHFRTAAKESAAGLCKVVLWVWK